MSGISVISLCCFLLSSASICSSTDPVAEAKGSVNLLAAIRRGHPLIRHQTKKTSTVTDTVLSTVSQTSICAKLVNVTGPCRTLKGRSEVEEPVVLTFDDDMDDFDSVLRIHPTKTQR